jgi:hypothetical protein
MSATEHRLSTAGGALECWSFVSDGLAALGQKELVFTFARQRDESIDPLAGQVGRLLITIHSLAAAGRIVEIGSFTEFGERRFLGSVAPAASHTCAPSLWRASPFPTARSPRYQLMGDEVETLKHFGMTRVAARLGERYRYYPWPPWWDRDRAGLTSVPQGAAMEEVYPWTAIEASFGDGLILWNGRPSLPFSARHKPPPLRRPEDWSWPVTATCTYAAGLARGL